MTHQSDAVFDYQPVLTGQLLRLRPLHPGDYTELWAIGSNAAVWALHPQPERATAAGFRAYFDDQLASCGALAAVNQADGALAGCSRFSTQFTGPGEMEIGWTFLGRSYWGGSYNLEMKWLMLNHAFSYVPRVIFRIGNANLRSRRAVEKIGAVLTDKVQHVTVSGRPSTNVYYAISKQEFAVSPLNSSFARLSGKA